MSKERSEMSNQEAKSIDSETQEKLMKFYHELHSIAPALGINYPFSPLVKYKYPPADRFIATNIARALLHHPKFYTQVVHLMNKMNLMPPFLPAPFVDVENELEDMILDDDSVYSEEESEIETEITTESNNQPMASKVFQRPRKRLKTGIIGEKKMKPKKVQFSSPTIPSKEQTTVFEPTIINPVTIKINVKKDLNEMIGSKNQEKSRDSPSNQGFGTVSGKTHANPPNEDDEQDDGLDDLLSDENLKDGLLSREEWEKFPVLQNYTKGSPSCRLYVKNLAKSVSERDLNRVYGRYIDRDDEVQRNMYHVQLFKSGRLRGQAFISLPEEQKAEQAIHETNSFMLHGKPMVVCFARSSKPKITEDAEDKPESLDKND